MERHHLGARPVRRLGQTIQAGTIVASNIAASTITASLLAAGIVVAGIVDTTNVFANTYVATNAGGEFLAYDTSSPDHGAPGQRHRRGGRDRQRVQQFPRGPVRAAAHPPQPGQHPRRVRRRQPVFYTSSDGRLRYLAQTGANLVLDRCVLELTNYSMTTQTTPHILSGTLNYLGGEANVGSEYELELDGTITTPTGTPIPFTFSFFLDGVIFGAGAKVDLGAVMLQAGQTFAYTLRCRATVEATGAGGTCTVAFDGGINRMLVPLGNVQAGGGMTASPMHLSTVGNAFDTTANHSLAVYANWTGSPASGSAVTLRTRKTRRN